MSKECEFRIPTKKKNEKIQFRIYHNKNSYNWATGDKLIRGYRLTATPIEVGESNGFTTVSFTAFSGFSDNLFECDRISKKGMQEAIKKLTENVPKYLKWFEQRGYSLEEGMTEEKVIELIKK